MLDIAQMQIKQKQISNNKLLCDAFLQRVWHFSDYGWASHMDGIKVEVLLNALDQRQTKLHTVIVQNWN